MKHGLSVLMPDILSAFIGRLISAAERTINIRYLKVKVDLHSHHKGFSSKNQVSIVRKSGYTLTRVAPAKENGRRSSRRYGFIALSNQGSRKQINTQRLRRILVRLQDVPRGAYCLYVTFGATPKTGQKTSKTGYLFNSEALISVGPVRVRHFSRPGGHCSEASANSLVTS